jgi:cryptochrome
VVDGSWRDLFPSGEGQEIQGEYESDHGEQADHAEDNEAKFEGDGAPHAGAKRARTGSETRPKKQSKK